MHLFTIYLPFSGAKPRQRRKRTAFTNDQLDRLEEEFREEKFPGIDLRTALADELGIREDRIQVREMTPRFLVRHEAVILSQSLLRTWEGLILSSNHE